MMRLSKPPELEVIKEFTDYHINRARGKDILNEFVGELRKFTRESNFIGFWDSHKDFYLEIAGKSGLEENIIRNTMEQLKEFFRKEESRYQAYVILAPFFHKTLGYGYWIEEKLFSFIGPWEIAEGFPIFKTESTISLIRHEFEHTFINSVTEKYKDLVENYSYLYKSIEGEMKRTGYGAWEITVNEHLTRTVDALIKLLYNRVSEEEVVSYLKKEEEMGFKYIMKFYEVLKQYLKSGLSFEDFYPRMLEYLKSY